MKLLTQYYYETDFLWLLVNSLLLTAYYLLPIISIYVWVLIFTAVACNVLVRTVFFPLRPESRVKSTFGIIVSASMSTFFSLICMHQQHLQWFKIMHQIFRLSTHMFLRLDERFLLSSKHPQLLFLTVHPLCILCVQNPCHSVLS